MTTSVEHTFQGNTQEQHLAETIYKLMHAQGRLFANEAPIRQSLENLAVFLAPQHKLDIETMASQIDAALSQNSTIFVRQEDEDGVIYSTSRTNHSIAVSRGLDRHMLGQRLYEPEQPLPTDDISVVVSLNRPALTTVEPVFISDYWQRQAGLTPIVPTFDNEATMAPVEVAPVEPVAEELLEAKEAPPEEVEVVEEVVVVEEVAPEVSSTSVVTLSDGTVADLALPLEDVMARFGPQLQAQLRHALENDPLRRIVFFGKDAFPETQVQNLGKNDLRRIKDYIVEVGEPVLDSSIISDLYHRSARDDGFETMRFSLNYRLSREKDFNFVGVEGSRLWSVSSLPSIGTKRLKASEMAQILTYLSEGYDDSLREVSAQSIASSGKVDHLLTFFEWQYGVLPFNEALRALLPPPLLDGQRTSVLRFESAQHYTVYVVELRYPTGNRGGWLQGLEDFFASYVVPGSLITLARTEEPTIFTISYEEAPARSDRLLTLDEKKNKLAFTNVTFYSTVDEDLLTSQQRYGKLKNLKFMPMSERRKEDIVLTHVFETIGEQVGTRNEPLYSASLTDLYVAMNVLRPTSRALLISLLEKSELFSPDSKQETYLYRPEPEETEGDEDEEEIDYRSRYDDEDDD